MHYEVRALDRSTAVVSMVFDAASAEDARVQAQQQGLSVLQVRAKGASAGWRSWVGRSGAAFPLGLFSQELLTLLEAGLSVVESIETLSEKETHEERRQLLGQLVAALYQGQALSTAMERFPGAFPALYVATVRASERTGDLPQSLRRYVIYHNQLDLVRKKVVSASIYPILLLSVGTLVIVFLLGYVVPRFAVIFEDLGRDLPYLSRLLMDWGSLVAQHTVALLAGVGTALTLLVLWLSRSSTRAAIWARLMRIPALGERMRIYQLARYYRTLGMLLRGGIPIMTALTMTAGLLGGQLRTQLAQATQQVRQGMPLSQAMEGAGLTTAVSQRMLRVGERTGQMGDMMERIAAFYDDEIARWVDWFVRLFEPVLMLIIGIAIGFIVVLMYFPIFELAGAMQ
jgi:general secretion pathway protein F